MITLTINGKKVTVPEDKKLMTLLREDLGIKSLKDGCSQGACGSCTILVDGKAVKACVQMASKFEGKQIETIESFSEREKEVYVYAFGKAGAVQCGFCIPGMVVCAKALLLVNSNPSRADIRKALRGNYCRCTGYQKIFEAVELAAKMFRENLPVPEETQEIKVGQRIARIDVREKVLGCGEYVDDMELPDMLYGSVVRSKYARAKIISIDTAEAEKLDGVACVLTAKDIPGAKKTGHIKKDWDVLIEEGEITHYAGDAVVLIAAKTQQIANRAKQLVKVTCEELPGVFSPSDACREDAILVHGKTSDSNLLVREHLVRGDADAALAGSKYVVTNHYSVPFTEHAFLEPECCVAVTDKEQKQVTIYSSDQGTYDTQREVAPILDMDPSQVHVINKLVGGGFGGKEDVVLQHHAALLSWYTGKPVKIHFTREESMLVHPKRHAVEMDFSTGCDENGILTGMKATIVTDTGAYASLGGPVLQRMCTHAAGPYNYQNIEIDGRAYYTNNPPAGAFRGFGVTQSCFATESNLNLLAEKVGISHWEIRFRNAIRPGQELPNGQIASKGTALTETLLAVKDVYDANPGAGIACAMKNAGVGVGLPDWGRCLIRIENGQAVIHAGASCIGQGLGTVLLQVLCETCDLTAKDVKYVQADTDAPDSGTTSGSRQTLVTGEAVRRAGLKLKKDLQDHTLSELEGMEYQGEYLAATDPMGSSKKNPVSHVAYGYATQVAVLGEDGHIKQITAAHDVGRAVNPTSCEGQIEGGVIMSMGYALTEDFPLKDGIPTAKYGTLGLLRSDQVPEINSILVEKNKEELAYGAIGIGEITSIPTAPAIAGAYYNRDGEFRTKLPLVHTPYERKVRKDPVIDKD